MNENTKRAMFIGRWQPFHKGHEWLIHQKMQQGKDILICVRDIPPDEANPFTTEETVDIIKTYYAQWNIGEKAHTHLNGVTHQHELKERVKVITIPDIESVNYGRGVGYEINEHHPDENVGFISATEIRKQIENDDDSWKKNVPNNVQRKVESYLKAKIEAKRNNR